MQKNLLFYAVALFSSVILFSSCSKKNDNGGGGNTTTITALNLSASKTSSIYANGTDVVGFSVQDQNGVNVTTQTTIYVDGNAITGFTKTFSPNEIGTHTVVAKVGSIVSNQENLSVVTAPAPPKYATKIIAEDFTGTWCGWCPRMTYKFERYTQVNNRIIPIGVHNGDAYAVSPDEAQLRSKFGVSGFPTVFINRNSEFNENGNINSVADSVYLSPFLKQRALLGIGINSSIAGNTLSITTKVGFDENISENLKIVIMVLEDGLIKSQSNYYANNNSYPNNPYINRGNPIPDFEHNGVYRKSPTGILGENIPTASQVKNQEYTVTKSVDITGYNSSKLRIVAFVVNNNGALNAQVAPANSVKDYDLF